MRRLLLAATFLLALSAHAQSSAVDTSRFAALHVGNRWEYARTVEQPAPTVVEGYDVAAVVGETTIDGASYVVLTQQAFNADRTPAGAPTHCAYSLTLGAAPAGSTSLPDYTCTRQLALPPHITDFSSVTPNQTIEISGDGVAVDSLLWFGFSGMGGGGSTTMVSTYYATGIGFVRYRYWGQGHAASGSQLYDRRTTLVYALIDGEEYGTRAVANETAPSAQPTVSLSAFPNPSAASFQVMTAGMSGDVVLDVFDALGRRVGAGVVRGGDAPFTFRAPSAGVYVVRARDEAGQTASVRVVRQ